MEIETKEERAQAMEEAGRRDRLHAIWGSILQLSTNEDLKHIEGFLTKQLGRICEEREP